MAALRLVDGTLLPWIPYSLSPLTAIIMDAMRWSKRKKQLERVEAMNEKRLKLRPSEEEGALSEPACTAEADAETLDGDWKRSGGCCEVVQESSKGQGEQIASVSIELKCLDMLE